MHGRITGRGTGGLYAVNHEWNMVGKKIVCKWDGERYPASQGYDEVYQKII